MAKFCGRCGAKLDESTGICPNCDDDKQKNAENRKHYSAMIMKVNLFRKLN